MKREETQKNVHYLPAKERWECQFCGKMFNTQKEAVEHVLKECDMVYE